MATDDGMRLVKDIFSSVMPQGTDAAAGFEMNDAMMQMMGGFTFLRLAGMMSTMGVNFTKEQLLDINSRLNKIKKI